MLSSVDAQFQYVLHGYKPIESQAKFNAQNILLQLAFLAYKSEYYQTCIYTVFLFNYLVQEEGVLIF